jgi:hypothetical protein
VAWAKVFVLRTRVNDNEPVLSPRGRVPVRKETADDSLAIESVQRARVVVDCLQVEQLEKEVSQV